MPGQSTRRQEERDYSTLPASTKDLKNIVVVESHVSLYTTNYAGGVYRE
tara:strand:+ start:391 stop:537 length:147 start_codon:yes stop_codon:yes gene_type:complete